MGTYFREEQKKSRWESGQAILHRELQKSKTTENTEKEKDRKSQKKQEFYGLKNSYGRLHYLEKEKADRKKSGSDRKGFVLEALEAPGTPLHTEKEKHLNPVSMKKISRRGKQTLFASEVPFRSQALFYDISDSKKSAHFLKYMKEIIQKNGHQTLKDAFGFLDQESERQELNFLTAEKRESLSGEFASEDHQRMDTLHHQLHRKEALERQMCSDLQLMLNQPREKKQSKDDSFFQRNLQSAVGNAENAENTEVSVTGEPEESQEESYG
ncbi:MAG: hypothetical protein HFH41_11465 [Lachnospiraceae bacterium]|nr:hypothetical protein [Lachnospiraceae bacterium]